MDREQHRDSILDINEKKKLKNVDAAYRQLLHLLVKLIKPQMAHVCDESEWSNGGKPLFSRVSTLMDIRGKLLASRASFDTIECTAPPSLSSLSLFSLAFCSFLVFELKQVCDIR